MSALRRIGDWLRWEMGRRIELDGIIRLIILDRFLKAVALTAGGVVLVAVSAHTDLHRLAEDTQVQLGLEPGRHLWRRLASWALGSLGAHPQVIGVGAVLYGMLEGAEGVGLVLRRRWAEYLVVLATSAFLPLEVSGVLRHPGALKALTLVINVAIVAYLVWRKRLFRERPGRPKTAGPAAVLRSWPHDDGR